MNLEGFVNYNSKKKTQTETHKQFRKSIIHINIKGGQYERFERDIFYWLEEQFMKCPAKRKKGKDIENI